MNRVCDRLEPEFGNIVAVVVAFFVVFSFPLVCFKFLKAT